MLKIVIADDDPRIRQVLRQTVAPIASTVYEAGDGGEAIELCAAQRPDWVLLDLRMKPVDGLHAAAAIKARCPATRIAIVTQYDDAALRAEAMRAGACAYVLKENLFELPALLTGAPPADRDGAAYLRPGTVARPAATQATDHQPAEPTPTESNEEPTCRQPTDR